ncbi:MAG: hypothetical protein AAFX41_12470 [Bacteroidota bacterium]
MRGWLTDWLSLLALLVLGLSAGAMLAESAILVPYWQTLAADQFFNWYASNAELLVGFYSPLQIASAVLALVATVLSALDRRPPRLWVLSTVLSLSVLALFFVYFKDANAGFANRSVAPQDLPGALQTWGAWQWARVALGTAAFATAAVAVMRRSGTTSALRSDSGRHVSQSAAYPDS